MVGNGSVLLSMLASSAVLGGSMLLKGDLFWEMDCASLLCGVRLGVVSHSIWLFCFWFLMQACAILSSMILMHLLPMASRLVSMSAVILFAISSTFAS